MNYISKVTGPCIILAGAGTGKTRSIIEKLKHIINKNIYKTEKIVCLTFSNEAVNTIIQRILPYLDKKEPIIKTFHSFCADLLRKHGEKIGISQNFKIILPDDGKILLHKYFKINPYLCNRYIEEISLKKDLGNNLENYSPHKRNPEEIEFLSKKLEDLKFKINTAHIGKIQKSQLDNLKIEKEIIESELERSKFYQIWNSYEKIKSHKRGLDYTDLHHKAIELLEKHPEISEEFDYIIIDEFQDTNKMQCILLDKIAKKRNITIVGDLNQSIYGFRGAYDENFNYFKKIMNVQNSDIFTLDKSYRSTNKILSVAHDLIKNNYKIKEECFEVKSAYNEPGENIKIYELKNSKEEVRKITEIIREEIKNNNSLKETCVIFRTHQQSNLLKKHLDYEDIPYSSINKESLLKIPVIKKVRAYLTVLEKLSNKSKGGDSSWWEIFHSSLNKKDSIIVSRAIKSLREKECISQSIMEEKIKGISKEGQIKLDAIRKSINLLLKESKYDLKDLIKKLYETLNLKNEEKDKEDNNFLALESFYKFVLEFSESDTNDLENLVYHINTIEALQITIESPSIAKDGIRIMTNHATKGLEYEAVIMSSMAQKKFPIEKTMIQQSENTANNNIEKQIMEERRLCYVGFTRAKKRLYMTYAKEYGQRKFEVSQFLKEINYQSNKNIEYIKDESELYQEPKDNSIKKEENIEDYELSFSPSALQTFDECQKRYEMKYIYNMPDQTPQSWEAITLGTFIHRVLEKIVENNYKTLKEVEDCTKIIQIEEHKDIKIEEAIPMIKLFFERNKSKYNENSMTEKHLETKIDGVTFKGFADRIDISDNGEITIIDYKTGKSDIKPKYRNWQLGIYALGSKRYGNPKKLILDMLQKEHPLEFDLDENGIAKEIHSSRTSFSLEQVKKEILETAKKMIEARKTGFKQCNVEKNCNFCQSIISNQ